MIPSRSSGRIAQILEFIFLSFFGIEILLRLYAYGPVYLMDVLNVVDAIIVFSLLIVQIILSQPSPAARTPRPSPSCAFGCCASCGCSW